MIRYAFKCNIKHKYIIFKISELNNTIEIQYYDSNINRFNNSYADLIEATFFEYKLIRPNTTITHKCKIFMNGRYFKFTK